MSLTNTEKSRALRERRAKLGQKELRGIYLTDAEEIKLKPMIRDILKSIRECEK